MSSPAKTGARVTVEVKRRESEKVFSELKVEVIGPNSYRARPDTVDVTVVGPPEVVRSLKPEQIVPTIDLVKSKHYSENDPGPGSTTLPITVNLTGVEVQVQPPEASVKW